MTAAIELRLGDVVAELLEEYPDHIKEIEIQLDGFRQQLLSIRTRLRQASREP